MDFKSINLSSQSSLRSEEPVRGFNRRRGAAQKKKSWKWGVILGVFVALLLGAYLLVRTGHTATVTKLVFSENPLKSDNGRVNVLLLGIGGGNHDGALLTDSIIVASYDLKSHKLVMFSLPRDLWLPDLKEKVNAVYEQNNSEKGDLSFAEDKIDDILGIKINYGARLDFSGFVKAIDLVGGVDVNVPITFDDYQYPIEGKEADMCGYTVKDENLSEDQIKALNLPSPIPKNLIYGTWTDTNPGVKKVLVDPQGNIATDSSKLDLGCRYEHLHFDKGPTHLDGTTALKFVRSRHGNNGEGSDFARSRRQQLVIEAFRNKMLSTQTLADPAKIVSIINTFGQSVDTDIPMERVPDFYDMSKNISSTTSVVLGDLGQGQSLFINPDPADYGGAWVLVPPNNDYTQVKKFVQDTLNGVPTSPTPSPSPSASSKKVNVKDVK